MDIAFPYGFDRSGRTAAADPEQHIRDLIRQVLLTAPGERVNRPTFGSGTGQQMFAPNGDMLAMAQQSMIRAGLQQWLSDLIQVQSVEVQNDDATLLVKVSYTVILTQQQQTAQFVAGAASP